MTCTECNKPNARGFTVVGEGSEYTDCLVCWSCVSKIVRNYIRDNRAYRKHLDATAEETANRLGFKPQGDKL